MSQRPNQPNLLGLPAELRCQIYEHAFSPVGNSFIDVTTHLSRHDGGASLTGALNLLRTCKLICNEARPILYGNRTFVFILPSEQAIAPDVKKHYLDKAENFLTCIGPNNLNLIKTLLFGQGTNSVNGSITVNHLNPLTTTHALNICIDAMYVRIRDPEGNPEVYCKLLCDQGGATIRYPNFSNYYEQRKQAMEDLLKDKFKDRGIRFLAAKDIRDLIYWYLHGFNSITRIRDGDTRHVTRTSGRHSRVWP